MESHLHGQDLTGELQADFADNNLSLTRLALQGKGFDLQASGELNQRLNMAAQISDFSRLVPGSSGTLQIQGWVRRRDGHLSGAVVGAGNKLSYAGTQISSANLTARLDEGTGYPLHVTATLRDLAYGGYTAGYRNSCSGRNTAASHRERNSAFSRQRSTAGPVGRVQRRCLEGRDHPVSQGVTTTDRGT